MPNQKVVPVKLNREQIAILDAIVEHGEFNGRSHAIRELLVPALEAGRVAINEATSFNGHATALMKYGSSMKALSNRIGTVRENAKKLQRDSKGQINIPLGDANEELFPNVITA